MFLNIKQIWFLLLILAGNICAQLELKMSTNKDTYEYGEKIFITCSVTNISDSTFRINSGSYNSCQAEFEFNNYYSAQWTACLPLVQELVYPPKYSRKYSWTIDPNKFGLPNKNGVQKIVGHYFYKNLTDTIYIQASMFMGGQLNVGFPTQNDTSLLLLKDSLKVQVLRRTEYPFTKNISETWQIYGYHLDSLQIQLLHDRRFDWVEYNRFIGYDSVKVTSVENDVNIIDGYNLSDAYPNPFNSTSRFYVEVPKTENVSIVLFNVLGEQISTIYTGILEKNSRNHFEINGKNMASGIYFYVLSSTGFYKSKKIILLK
ncbi:MAG: T9SS type A sorting domain-containing protein [Bacteroidetes bacterium]|nr:T9SS type A sorting domain-containing protein [Bacteroidota bacterium]